MSYFGTTQASSLANPPRNLIVDMSSPPVGAAVAGSSVLSTANPAGPGTQGGGLWYYNSTNLTTDITQPGFFSDGLQLGMRPGDLVFGVQFSSAGSTVTTFQGAVASVTSTGASLSTGSLMTSTFN